MTVPFTGTGTLSLLGGEESCRYHFSIYEDRGLRTGTGHIAAEPDVLASAFVADRVTLTLDDGRSCRIIVRSAGDADGMAAIQLAGAIA